MGKKERLWKYNHVTYQERLSTSCREELTQQLCERLKLVLSSLFSLLFIHTVSCQSESNMSVILKIKYLTAVFFKDQGVEAYVSNNKVIYFMNQDLALFLVMHMQNQSL